MAVLSELFDLHGLPSYDKQLALALVVEGRRYSISYANGVLSFGPDLAFGIEVLGSQSDYDNTWLWAWANDEIAGWPIDAALQVREEGMRQQVAELEEGMFSLEAIDGHYLAMVATGLLGADCYYRCPYDEGAAFVVVRVAPAVRAASDLSAHYVTSRVMDFICKYDCHNQTAIESYLRYKGYTFSYVDGELVGRGIDDQSLRARFAPDGRLEQIEAVITGPIYPPNA